MRIHIPTKFRAARAVSSFFLRWLAVPSLVAVVPLGMAADGDLDLDFDPGAGPDNIVNAMVVRPDGKILIGGLFENVAGTARNRIARLNDDGTHDTGFDPGAGANNPVRTLALQTDGKILVGGSFTADGGEFRTSIARLEADGGLDMYFNLGDDINGFVHALALRPDGKILLGGEFSQVADAFFRRGIARLAANATPDSAFGPDTEGNPSDTGIESSHNPASVSAVALQSDGKVLIGGRFDFVDGEPRTSIARLNADGSVDTGFVPGTGAGPGGLDPTQVTVNAIAVQPDGKVIIGGRFEEFDGVSRHSIARLNADGSLDTGFDPGTGADNAVRAVAVLPDGKVMVGGSFSEVDGMPRGRIARLNADGSLDSGFDEGHGVTSPGGNVYSLVVQQDGKVLMAGNFSEVAGTTRNSIARLDGTPYTPPVAAPAVGNPVLKASLTKKLKKLKKKLKSAKSNGKLAKAKKLKKKIKKLKKKLKAL